MKFIGLFFLVTCVTAETSYRSHKILEVTPSSDHEVELLRSLNKPNEGIEFEKFPVHLGQKLQVLVSPERVGDLFDVLHAEDIPVSITDRDIQSEIEADLQRINSRNGFDPDDFNRYETIMSEVDRLARDCPASLRCTTKIYGKSYEGRDLKLIKISSGRGKKAVFVDSLIHAREWVAGATVLKILNRLITEYESNPEVKEMVDTFDWIFAPVINPDGYEYTFTDDRFWRKSRKPNKSSFCKGTDLNRNFDYKWGEPGADSNPCGQTYRGDAVADNLEVSYLQAEGERLRGSVIAWLNVHTAAEMWLLPFGDCTDGVDYRQQQRVADAACDAMNAASDKFWLCDNSCRLLYPTSGTASDWSYAKIDAKYSYTPELRGPGFNPGRGAIAPSFREQWEGIKAMIREIKVVENGAL